MACRLGECAVTSLVKARLCFNVRAAITLGIGPHCSISKVTERSSAGFSIYKFTDSNLQSVYTDLAKSLIVRTMKWRDPDQEVDLRGRGERLCKKTVKHVIEPGGCCYGS